MKNKNLNNSLLTYSQYCLPAAELGSKFLEEVDQLFTGLKSLQT